MEKTIERKQEMSLTLLVHVVLQEAMGRVKAIIGKLVGCQEVCQPNGNLS